MRLERFGVEYEQPVLHYKDLPEVFRRVLVETAAEKGFLSGEYTPEEPGHREPSLAVSVCPPSALCLILTLFLPFPPPSVRHPPTPLRPPVLTTQ